MLIRPPDGSFLLSFFGHGCWWQAVLAPVGIEFPVEQNDPRLVWGIATCPELALQQACKEWDKAINQKGIKQ